MSVFRRPDSPVWYYEFEHKGVRYRASTGQEDENDARAVEAKARLRVRREAAGVGDPEPAASVTFTEWAEHYYLHAKDRLKLEIPCPVSRSSIPNAQHEPATRRDRDGRAGRRTAAVLPMHGNVRKPARQ